MKRGILIGRWKTDYGRGPKTWLIVRGTRSWTFGELASMAVAALRAFVRWEPRP